MIRFAEFCCASLLCLLFISSGSAETAGFTGTGSSYDGRIQIDNNGVTADLRNAPLRGVIREIGEKSNIWFKGDESVIDEKVSVQFKDLPLEESLKRILINCNYSVIYDGKGRVAGLYILGKEKSGRDKGSNINKVRTFEHKTGKPARSSTRVVTRPSPAQISKSQPIRPTNILKATPNRNVNSLSENTHGISRHLRGADVE